MPNLLLRRRRPGVLMLVAIAVLAAGACGSGGASSASDTTSRENTVAGTEGGTRTVEDATGTVELPTDYSRAVPTDGIWAANMLSLGVEPVAVPDDVVLQLSTVADYLPPGTDLESLPRIGIQYEINIEALAAARPDLIIASGFEAEELGQEFREIAPTYFVPEGSNGVWRERFRQVAEALDRQDRVAAVEEEYDALVTSLPDAAREGAIAFIRTSSPDSARLDILESSFPGSVATGAGIPVLDVSDQVAIEEDASFVEIGPEQLGLLEGADFIVVSDLSFYDETLDDSLTVLEQNPLWANLPAVQAGRVIQVPGPVYNGGSYQAATALLTEIAKAHT